MDVWSKEQVEHMRQTGNIKSNEKYNPDEVRHPPPTNMIDIERDSDIEKFIRNKYEFKRFFKSQDRSSIVAAHLGPSRSAGSHRSATSSPSFPPSPSRAQTFPSSKSSLPSTTSAPAAPPRAPTVPLSAPTSTTMNRSVSQPISPPAQLPRPPTSGVWSDLASLQNSAQTSTLPLQYLSPTTSTPSNVNPTAGGTNLGANFTTASSNIGLASQGLSLGSSISPGPDIFGQSLTTAQVQSPFVSGTGGVNPFTQLAAQRQAQAQAQQTQLLSMSPFGSSLSQQPSFAPQIQQPTFSPSVTNPFFNAAAQSQGTVSPQPQALYMSTSSPVPFTGSPYQQPAPSPFQQQPLFQQPTQSPYQPQPSQFGNVQAQSSGATVAANPFTSWLTQPPNTYANAHVGQGSVNGQWGSM